MLPRGNGFRKHRGLAQGSIISPTLSNVVLDALDALFDQRSSGRFGITGGFLTGGMGQVIRYADDCLLVATGDPNDLLTSRNKVASALGTLGLELNRKKSATHAVDEGFVLLGFEIRRSGELLEVLPSEKKVEKFLADVRQLFDRSSPEVREQVETHLRISFRSWQQYFGHCTDPARIQDLARNIEQLHQEWIDNHSQDDR